MKLDKKQLDLKSGIEKEWVITNGIGGYASQTVLGINTRKYHGLLVAPLMPPARRYVILSKVDESICIDDKEEILYSNMGKTYITEGYKKMQSFEKIYNPKFTYITDDGIVVEKTISMVYGKNTVCVYYKVKNIDKKITMKIAPVMNFRDFHQMSTNHIYHISQQFKGQNKVRVTIDRNKITPIYLYLKDGKYIEHEYDIFKNIFYLEEERRGFFPEEDLIVSGRYEVEISPNEIKEFTFVCSLEENIEELDGKEVNRQEEERLEKIVHESELIDSSMPKKRKEILRDLIIASDSFITYRQQFSLHTIIAGFPWFLDWGRDTLIAYEGLLLKTKRYEIAREILLMMTRDIKFGLIPNGYSGYDSRPLYNSVDSSLLLYEQINKYIEYTGDYDFIKQRLYDILKNVARSFQNGINLDDSNIYMDKDGLISAGTENTQLTWMDAKVSNIAVTPRSGKAVEVNALWYNALKTLELLAKKFEDKQTEEEYSKLAKKVKTSFNKKFYNEDNKCLYDVLGNNEIRPNQLFALAITHPVMVLSNDKPKQMLKVVTDKLYTRYGLATLSPDDKKYVATYEGDSFRRDMSYHQGITWPWLAGIYVGAFKTVIKNEKDKEEKEKLENQLKKIIANYKKYFALSMNEGAVGTISELYDSKPPYRPGGTISQAWSVSEAIKIFLEKE